MNTINQNEKVKQMLIIVKVNAYYNCVLCTGETGADLLYNKFNVTLSGLPVDPPRDPNDNGCLVTANDYWKLSQCTNEHRVVCQSGKPSLRDFSPARRVSNAIFRCRTFVHIQCLTAERRPSKVSTVWA